MARSPVGLFLVYEFRDLDGSDDCRGGGGTLGIFGWGCAAGTLEPLAYTRASSAEFRYPIPDKTH